MEKNLLFSLMLVGLLVSGICASQSTAGEFHVTNATEFQNALNTAESNGEDDTIYLGAGIYQGNFSYMPPDTEHKSLAITGEPGTSPEDVILDGQNSGRVLLITDSHDYSDGVVPGIFITGITVQNGNSNYTGGGIYAAFSSYNISMTRCIIKNNKTTGKGGGVWMGIQFNGSGTVVLENNVILNNMVTENDINHLSVGGGVYVYSGSSTDATFVIRNNIIAGNAAQGADPHGGGLYVYHYSDTGTVTHLINNTIYGNMANKGGGVSIYRSNNANTYNNIIYGNSAMQGADIYFQNVTSTIGYNNNYSNMYGTWTDSGANLNTDPLFVSTQNNDFRLQPTSSMINAGTTAVPDPPGLPSTDFEGNPRVTGPAPDIGAYESFPVNPSEGTIGREITITGSGFGARKGKVLVGTVALKILEWTGSSIRCQLTRALSPGPYDVTIRPKGVSAIVLEDGFTVKVPEIESVEPTSGLAGDEITINGLFFGTKKPKVTLGGKSCKVLSWTKDPTTGESEIDFVVPKRLTLGGNELKVANGVGSGTTTFTVE